MKLAVRRTSAALAAFATVGVSSIFLGVAPASAATEACGATGTVVGPGICELTLTSGTTTFTPTAQMTQLEVLLVGSGGAGADQPDPNTNGYASAGGAGEVLVLGFDQADGPMDISVADAAVDPSVSSVTQAGVTEEAGNGQDAAFGGETGGTSGSGNVGANGISGTTTPYGAGAGDSASPTNNANGGEGTVISDIVAATSLFATDANCYGGGGAIGTPTVQGVPGCGAGGPTDATGTALLAPAANTGSGGGGLTIPQTLAARSGASGVAVVRWTAANVTLAFAANGHGTAPTAQVLPAGSAATRPADPTAAGYEFRGWYTDAQLTTLADFSAPVTGSVTYYASWAQTLAVTGADLNPAQIPLALTALLAGAGLLVFAARRKRRTN